MADSIKSTPGFENARPVRFGGQGFTVGYGDPATLAQLHKGGNGHAWLGKAFGISDAAIKEHLSVMKQRGSLHPDDAKFLKSSIHAGGPGSGRHPGDGEEEAPKKNKFGQEILTNRQKVALANHKNTGGKEQAIAEKGEIMVRNAIGGVRTANNMPFDSLSKNGKHAVEVKTLVSNTRDQITMKSEAISRKMGWAQRNGAKAHTVVVDMRGAKGGQPVAVYHKEGVGSFRIGGMTQVKGGMAGLAKHIK